MSAECNLCPRKCNIDRNAPGITAGGFCGVCDSPVVARAGVHMWEEPCISGERGSGTVFFSGCNLRCVYCQNKEISSERFGKRISVSRLREIYLELCAKGVHNINLVTPTHFAAAVCESLSEPLPVPVVWNSGGYDSVSTLNMLEGKIQIYLPDWKYADSHIAQKYSAAADYPVAAEKAILEMYRQVGEYELTDDGIMKKGVIIRHLVLPGCLDNTKRVIDRVYELFGNGKVLFSLMSQYTPVAGVPFSELQRRLTEEEYGEVSEYLYSSGIEDGFMQELSSAKEEYIPPFDLSGV